MANLGEVYEAHKGLLPAGQYVAVISNSKIETSKNSGNKYLSLFVNIVADESGKKFSIPITVFDILNIFHPDLNVKSIAKKTLGSIIDACGKKTVANSEELHGIPIKVNLIVEVDDRWGDKNKIKNYLPLNNNKIETKAQAPQQQIEPKAQEDFPEADAFEVPDIF